MWGKELGPGFGLPRPQTWAMVKLGSCQPGSWDKMPRTVPPQKRSSMT